jgi:hypothetical protein
MKSEIKSIDCTQNGIVLREIAIFLVLYPCFELQVLAAESVIIEDS